MGYNQAGISYYFNFDSVPFNIVNEARAIGFLEANASICNAQGQMNFYTNGICIANANNDTMMNGDGLNPSPYTTSYEQYGIHIGQADIIIPFPDDSMKYYLFHETSEYAGTNYQPKNLFQSIVDMSLDGGLGAVILKNNPIIQDTLVYGELTACKHANGRDWWLICHSYNSDEYYKLLITPNGIQSITTQNIGSVFFEGGGGQSCFSPDGNWYARYNAYDSTDLDILSFDRCTGDFSNPINILFNDSAYVGGVAFSPNSQVLYVTSQSYIYQFDMTSANIPASQKTVATWDGYFSPQFPFASLFYMSQLANDGKIYISCGNSTVDIHVINYPNLLDTLCEVCQHCIHLPSYHSFGVPNLPNYYLGADTLSICDSVHVGIENTVKHLENHLSVYINSPAQKILVSAQGLAGKNYSLSIYDIRAREVFKSVGVLANQYFSTEINSILFSKGLYVISLQTEKEILNQKFVVE